MGRAGWLFPHSQVFGYCMFKDGKEARVGYPSEGHAREVAGRSFHNGADSTPTGASTIMEAHGAETRVDDAGLFAELR